MPAQRERDLPAGARDVRQPQVGVEPERDRDRRAARRVDRGRDPQPLGRQRSRDLQLVRERERGQQLGLGAEVEPGGEPLLVMCRDPPVRRRVEKTVDREPVLLAVDERRARRQPDVVPAEGVVVAVEPVGPRIQQRHAHHRSGARVGEQPRLAVQQLVAAMAQRYAGHAERGRECRLQRSGRHGHRLEAFDGHAGTVPSRTLALRVAPVSAAQWPRGPAHQVLRPPSVWSKSPWTK